MQQTGIRKATKSQVNPHHYDANLRHRIRYVPLQLNITGSVEVAQSDLAKLSAHFYHQVRFEQLILSRYVYGLIVKQCKTPVNNLQITSLILYVDYGRYFENSMFWKINLDGERRQAKMYPVSS
jgi:hypothetical protein